MNEVYDVWKMTMVQFEGFREAAGISYKDLSKSVPLKLCVHADDIDKYPGLEIFVYLLKNDADAEGYLFSCEACYGAMKASHPIGGYSPFRN